MYTHEDLFLQKPSQDDDLGILYISRTVAKCMSIIHSRLKIPLTLVILPLRNSLNPLSRYDTLMRIYIFLQKPTQDDDLRNFIYIKNSHKMYVDPTLVKLFHQKLLRASKECRPLLRRSLAYTIKQSVSWSLNLHRYNIFMISQETHPRQWTWMP